MHAQFERYRAMVEAALPLALPKDCLLYTSRCV